MERSKRLIIALLLLFLILCPLAIAGLSPIILVDWLQTFTTVFLGMFIEAAPFLLAGTLASGLIKVFVSREWILRLVPRNPLVAALIGSVLGLAFPVCECGVVPVTRRLFRKGLPLSASVAYLVAAPVINPIVIASTWAAYGFGRMLLARVGFTLVIAVTIGCVFALARGPRRVLRPIPAAPLDPHPSRRWFERLSQAMVVAGDEFFEMGRYLVLGSLLAAAMQTLAPQAALLGIGSSPVTSVLAMMLLAFVLSVCSTVDAFVSLTFTGTFTAGSILAFLVFGPMVDLKSLLMFLGVFQPRAVVYLVLLPLAMTLFAALFLNLNVGW